MFFKKLALALLLLLMAVPASAHNLPVGGSRWCFGKDHIIGNIDLSPTLLSEIKGIKEGNCNLDSLSEDQLRQIAHDIIQPYIDQKLSITVESRPCPIKVDKVVRNGNDQYTIWLSVENAGFRDPSNPVMISYRLLFEETGGAHVNLAYGYLSDATGAALQKVFDFSPPAFQTTFDANNTAWAFSVNGPADASVPKPDAVKAAKATPAGVAADAVAHRNVAEKPEPRQVRPVPPVKADQAPLPKAQENGSASDVPTRKPVWSSISQFLALGVEHILTGYDHIAFLLALIVIGLSLKGVLKIVTAFTIAHSITLLLAALQVVSLSPRLVESAIALSICYVAAENLLSRKINYRWLVTFGFGLIHGFGFASALQELIVGRSSLLLSVLSFNIGVELGQLMIILVLLPVLYLLKKQFQLRIVTVGTSIAIFIIGFNWLLERSLDLKLLG